MRLENAANKQIQAMPTPFLFVRFGATIKQDTATAALILSEFLAYEGTLVNAGTETAIAGLALSAMITNGAQPTSTGDSATGLLALSAFVSVVADVIPTQTETATAGLALSAFISVTAQVTPTQTDDVTAGIALSAYIAP